MAGIGDFGHADGKPVTLHRLGGDQGIALTLTSLGARVVELWAEGRDGTRADVALGHETAQDYLTQPGYLGATCGRFANRIAGGRLPLDGQVHQLDRNEGPNQLHGGSLGFDRAIWQVASATETEVTFTHLSPAGDMGYPGEVAVSCTYRLHGPQALLIEMTATTTAPTVVNLAHHGYYNLAGQGSGDVLGHHLQVAAGHYLPVGEGLIPTGAVLPVAGTAFDLTTARRIGDTLPGAQGFDHCFCLSAPLEPVAGHALRPCAWLTDPASGRSLRLSTNQPGVQVYTGAHFDGDPGKSGARYPRFAGVALETQGFPDAPNHPQFPSTRLAPGEVYRHLMLLDLTPLG